MMDHDECSFREIVLSCSGRKEGQALTSRSFAWLSLIRLVQMVFPCKCSRKEGTQQEISGAENRGEQDKKDEVRRKTQIPKAQHLRTVFIQKSNTMAEVAIKCR